MARAAVARAADRACAAAVAAVHQGAPTPPRISGLREPALASNAPDPVVAALARTPPAALRQRARKVGALAPTHPGEMQARNPAAAARPLTRRCARPGPARKPAALWVA